LLRCVTRLPPRRFLPDFHAFLPRFVDVPRLSAFPHRVNPRFSPILHFAQIDGQFLTKASLVITLHPRHINALAL
jgi:hypothetical protein